MKSSILPYRIFPLGDAVLTVDFGNIIDETLNHRVLRLFNSLQHDPLPGMIEVIPSYSSLSVYYDPVDIRNKNNGTAFEIMSARLKQKLDEPLPDTILSSRLIQVPVCYEEEFAPDIKLLAKTKNITIEDIVRIHTSREYRVYMLGFLPGFSYMGEVDESIAIPRRSKPATVAAGSVGIAGKQTGIYPMTCPGGWRVIGRTPLQMFDAENENPALLKTGDRIQFIPISKNEFENY